MERPFAQGTIDQMLQAVGSHFLDTKIKSAGRNLLINKILSPALKRGGSDETVLVPRTC